MTAWPTLRTSVLFILLTLLNPACSTDTATPSINPAGGSTASPSVTPSSITPKAEDLSIAKFTILTLDSETGTEAKTNDTNNYEVKEVAKNSEYHYKFKDGVKCTEVKYDNASVWTHDSSKSNEPYPKSLLIYLKTKRVMLTFKEEDFLYAFNLVGTVWKTLANGKVLLVQLDVDTKKETTELNYIGKEGVGTYTARGNVLFKEVIQKKCPLNCAGSDKVIWEANEPGQYCYKVERDGISTCGTFKNVKLYLLNGDVLKFVKSGCLNKQWSEVQVVATPTPTAEETTRAKPSEAAKPSEGGTAASTNKKTESTVTMVELNVDTKKETTETNYSKSGSTHTWTAKDNYGFNKVNKGNNVVWTAPADAKEGTKKVVLCTNSDGKPTVKVGDDGQVVWTQY